MRIGRLVRRVLPAALLGVLAGCTGEGGTSLEAADLLDNSSAVVVLYQGSQVQNLISGGSHNPITYIFSDGKQNSFTSVCGRFCARNTPHIHKIVPGNYRLERFEAPFGNGKVKGTLPPDSPTFSAAAGEVLYLGYLELSATEPNLAARTVKPQYKVTSDPGRARSDLASKHPSLGQRMKVRLITLH